MSFSKPVTEIIKERFSCRSYVQQPIEEEKRSTMSEVAASNGAGPFGTRARFELVAATEQDRKALRGLGTYGIIRGATGFVVGAMKEADKNLEDFGYLMERIILCATDLGLGTCWLGGTFTKSRFAKKISATKEESVPAVTSVGYIAKKRGTTDLASRQWARSDHRLAWDRLFFDGRFGAPLPQEAAGSYAVPLEMVRLGPSASNKQPWRIVKEGQAWHFYMQRTAGYRRGTAMRVMNIADMQRIDMGIAMSHFELTAEELGLHGRWEIQEPEIENPGELTEYTVSWIG
jgi:nitroreductase